MNFQYRVPVVIRHGRTFTRHLVVFFLNVVPLGSRCRKIEIAVEAGKHESVKLILGLLHPVRIAFGTLQVGGPVIDNEILHGNEHRYRNLADRIVIDFLECRACQCQTKQKHLHLVSVFRHYLGHEVIHLRLDALGLIHDLSRHGTYDFCPDGA